MKTITLSLPSDMEVKKVLMLKQQVQNFCQAQNHIFSMMENSSISIPQIKIEFDLKLVKIARGIARGLSAKDMGDFSETIVGEKKIRQYLTGNRKTNQQPYFVDNTADPGDVNNPDNWARKKRVDPDDVVRNTAGKVIMTTPVHLTDDSVICLDPTKKESDRIYAVKGSSKPYRKFDGSYRKHCSGCPFPEGCIMCTLP